MKPFPKLSSAAILSPMAGVTDVAFRTLCKKYGAGMTYTEFVSSAALVRNNTKTQDLLVTDPSEKPVGVQLFGANEEEVVEAAKLVAERFDVVDMNCGCPAHKVIKTGAGSAMLNDPARIGRLVKQVVEAIDKPVTVKIRAGIDDTNINAVEVAKAVEKAGASAIAVHGRTQKQGYTGLANWDVIKAVKEAVSIPVIGNGDVFSAADFKEKMKYSNCDYIMIARGAIGNPGIFAEILGKECKKGKRELFLEYYKLAQQYNIPFTQIKGHVMHFTKGEQGGARLREALTKASDEKELLKAFE
ncbi:tRNA dihydrouridine synthase DusB [Candidatus Woesearchaeota archaeon]|nr:tRNA dihydrouridine synthase DusB [Candidatus Woesearchaeota archaeon]